MKFFFNNSWFLLILIVLISFSPAQAQLLKGKKTFTHQDTLRGTLGPERSWWDVMRYDITVKPDYDTKSITGKNIISYVVTKDGHPDTMQIDLQEPMQIDSVVYNNRTLLPGIKREGNAFHVTNPKQRKGSKGEITVYFHGTPREAVRPPWDGGWIWTKDIQGRPWMSVACQGLGASVWYPCKDHQSDEPDNGASLSMVVPDSLVAVGNGRLASTTKNNDGTSTWKWVVKNPINNYDIIPYIGEYVNFTDTYNGEKGKLDLSYWVLDYNLEKAQQQFKLVQPMMKCFEDWMGPYPFYEDSYKLVDAPHLGMEHQSAVAYGNHYMNGYLGRDLSGTGWGSDWDYIIVHESGHEWFGNNITTKDIADMWVHEGFTTYSEVLFVECRHGLKAANEYCQGIRQNIRNQGSVIGTYGVNEEGSGDMYPKGANMIHAIRQVINNDALFKSIIRELNKDFYHKTVTSAQVEQYISAKSGKDFSKVFDQYLRTVNVPVLEYKVSGNSLRYRWGNCIPGFNMPVKLNNGKWLAPITSFKTVSVKDTGETLTADPNFYVQTRAIQ